MTAPSYTEDLTDLSTAESATSWVEMTGLSYNGQGAPAGGDADYPFIQGQYAVTQDCTKDSTIGSLAYNNGSGTGGHGTDGAYLVWQSFSSAGNIDTYANGGFRLVVGSGTADFKSWDVGGRDKAPYPYGGWQCHAVNTSVSADDTAGTPTATEQYIGAAVNVVTGPKKGEPHQVDVIRYGRCSAIFEYGEATAGYCTLEDFAKANDANDISFTADTTNASPNLTNISAADIEPLYPGAPVSGTGIPASTFISYISGASTAVMTNNATATNTGVSVTSQPYNMWGLIQKVSGGYLWQGRWSLGTASNAVDFRDSNKIVFVKWTPKVTSDFNTIEILNASSRVDMTNFQFIQLDTTTASRGRWITTNDADVNLDVCSWQDMGTFTFDSNTTADECTWTRCLQIDPGGGDLSFSNVLLSDVTGGGSAGGGALLWNDAGDPNTKLNDMTFSKGSGDHHAIEFGTSAPTTINLTNMTFTGFSASDQQNTSVLYFPDKGTDTTWTVTHNGTTGTVSYYKARSGDTVTIQSGAVTVEAHTQTAAGDDIASALIFLRTEPWATLSGTDISLNENGASADTITRTTGSFITDGWQSADYVTIKNSATAANDGTYTIVSVAALTLTLSIGDLTADDSSNANLEIAGTGPFPYEDIVTISNSGTTATVTHNSHGMATNDYVFIDGGTVPANEGVFQITVTGANTYTYTMASSPGASPTGEILATFVALWGTTDANGDLSTSRVYASNQKVRGWARKSTSSPYYKEFPFLAEVDSNDGLSLTAVMTLDE